MQQKGRWFSRRNWRVRSFIISPVVAIVVLQSFIFLARHSWLWGRARKTECVCVLQGPTTPFGELMFIGAFSTSSKETPDVKIRKIGIFFVSYMEGILDLGYRFDASGQLHLFSANQNVWTIDPWRGEKELSAKIESQSNFLPGKIDSDEFCVAGNSVWFKDGSFLFVQEQGRAKRISPKSGLGEFDILGCTEDYAYLNTSGDGYYSGLSIAYRDGRDPVQAFGGVGCIFRYGDAESGRLIYERERKGEEWFFLWTESADKGLIPSRHRLQAQFGCGGRIFLISHEGEDVSYIEEFEPATKTVLERFSVKGNLRKIACRCLSSAKSPSEAKTGGETGG